MARTQRLIALLPFLFLFFAASAQAEPVSPVTVSIWDNSTPDNQFNSAPPLPDTDPVQVYGADVVWHNFDAQPVANLYEDFVVRFEGTLTTDADTAVRFYAPADDGVKFYLNDALVINDWFDKGGGGSVSDPVQFTAGVSQSFTLWFYENGGGAWVQLWWQINDEWQPVPMSAYAKPVPTTTTSTTTTSTTTTVPATTTTEMMTTTTYVEAQSSTPSTTLETTTTIPEETTSTTTSVVVSEMYPKDSPQDHQSVTSQPVETSVPVPNRSTVPVPLPTDAPTTTQQMPTPEQPIQEQSSLPPTEEYQSAQIINGGVIGVGLKPQTLISRGLRKDVSPAQQRMVVAASVLIAMPTPVGATRRKTTT